MLPVDQSCTDPSEPQQKQVLEGSSLPSEADRDGRRAWVALGSDGSVHDWSTGSWWRLDTEEDMVSHVI